MKIFPLIVAALVSMHAVHAAETATVWEPRDVVLEADGIHPWWEFPVRAAFTHEASGEQLAQEGFWDGGRSWRVRFAAPRTGIWTYQTTSQDRGLNRQVGRFDVQAATAIELERNPNLRGQVRVASGGRHFEFADGTPFLLLADTLWAANTARCGLGEREDGPFFQYLADREAKGFTAVLMSYFHGYGDYPDSPGHRNEGGYAFTGRDVARLNPAHFQSLDTRMRALWSHGFVGVIPATWWGKTKQCLFTPEDARRVSAYCAVRYGAFNALWSLAGEYQYVFKDCGWTAADITALGETVQRHNPYRHPLSIHPSAATHWPAPHHAQSSRAFHGEPWLDHHWLQTGQSRDRMRNIVTRLAENRSLTPALPVFCSESFYEHADDAEGDYLARWQVWAAFLNGAAGYGYGAEGVWQFTDPADPHGERGKDVKGGVPWRQALALPGSAQMLPTKKLLTTLDWWKLAPQRGQLRVDGQPNPLPTMTDLSPPHLAVIAGQAMVAYLPRGNAHRELTLPLPPAGSFTARWFDPRRGEFIGAATPAAGTPQWTLPARPAPAEEDWVLVLGTEAVRF